MAKNKHHKQDDVTDLGALPEQTTLPQDDVTNLGTLTSPVTETVDMGHLPTLAKFKKFQKKGI